MIQSSDAVWVADYGRSPFSRAHPLRTEVDAYADVPGLTIISYLNNALVAKAGIAPDDIDSLHIGCAFPVKDQWSFGGRYGVMQSELGWRCAAVQLEQQCASGLSAVISGAQAILHGADSLALCGGYENMSRVPMGPSLFEQGVLTVPAAESVHAGHPDTDLDTAMHMGLTAEKLAHQKGVSRERMDAFACRSHQRAHAARQSAQWDDNLLPLTSAQGGLLLATDANIRPDTCVEKLSDLRPVFNEAGVISAGNSSPYASGAALVLLAGGKALKTHQLDPLARIVAATSVGLDPELMGYGVVPAVKKLLNLAKLTVDDIGLWEINEAFSVVPLAAIDALKLDPERVNPHGGAIALGHPLGATGARLVGQLARALARREERYGVATLCVGGGQGVALLLESAR